MEVLKAVADALESSVNSLLPSDARQERLHRIMDLVARMQPSDWPALEQHIEARLIEGAKSKRAHRIAAGRAARRRQIDAGTRSR